MDKQQPGQSAGLNPPQPVLPGSQTFATVSDQIADYVIRRPLHPGWLLGTTVTFGLVMLLFYAITWLMLKGIGIWGVQIPVAWGFAIANFVWWIGIGHAGTLISA